MSRRNKLDIFFGFQDESTGEITFYMKGADVVMAGIVQYNDWLEEEVRFPSFFFFFTNHYAIDSDFIAVINKPTDCV